MYDSESSGWTDAHRLETTPGSGAELTGDD